MGGPLSCRVHPAPGTTHKLPDAGDCPRPTARRQSCPGATGRPRRARPGGLKRPAAQGTEGGDQGRPNDDHNEFAGPLWLNPDFPACVLGRWVLPRRRDGVHPGPAGNDSDGRVERGIDSRASRDHRERRLRCGADPFTAGTSRAVDRRSGVCGGQIGRPPGCVLGVTARRRRRRTSLAHGSCGESTADVRRVRRAAMETSRMSI